MILSPFFNGLGKASFLATLFEYSKYICANSEYIPGTLADTTSLGKLSFIRLVGCAYFRKHRAVFLPAYPSPATLYNTLKCRKNDSHCGPGCKCQSCHNLPSGSSNTASQPSPLVRQPPSAEIESSDSDDSGDESGNDS